MSLTTTKYNGKVIGKIAALWAGASIALVVFPPLGIVAAGYSVYKMAKISSEDHNKGEFEYKKEEVMKYYQKTKNKELDYSNNLKKLEKRVMDGRVEVI
ncbi:MAG: hypothetical protein NUV46_00310 [Nanoarchaeota archaeon]|nr:hypothetical protein [Nanoarchaeota archaeon]